MNCHRIMNQLSAYLDGELGGQEMLLVREHLRVCTACQAELAELKSVKEMLSGLQAMAPSAGFEERLKLSVFRETSMRPVFPMRALAVSFGAITACFALWIATRQPDTSKQVIVNSTLPSEIARDQAFAAGGDPLTGHVPVMPVNYGQN